MYHQFWFIFADSCFTRSGPGLKFDRNKVCMAITMMSFYIVIV